MYLIIYYIIIIPYDHNITGWWFGTCFIFPYIGIFIIPTDELHHFSEG